MKKRSLFAAFASTFILCLIWELLSRKVSSSLILPSIADVLTDSAKLFTDPGFLGDLMVTFMRGIVAFFISFALSCVLGILSGLFPLFSAALSPWMAVIKSTPVVSFILIAILWFGSGIVPVFVAVLMTLPVMTEAASKGVSAADGKLLEMSRVYRMSRFSVLRNIRIPSAMPFILAGAGASFGLTWKVVVAGEILGFPKSGLGSAMQTAKVHLETPRVFSLTIVAILISAITEALFINLAKAASRHGKKAAEQRSGSHS